MQPNEVYTWELELTDGTVLSEASGDRWQDADPERVLRASVVPRVDDRPRHDVFCHADNLFRERFGRGFIKQQHNFQLSEYAQCIGTQCFRLWVLSSGRVLTTPPDYMLRL